MNPRYSILGSYLTLSRYPVVYRYLCPLLPLRVSRSSCPGLHISESNDRRTGNRTDRRNNFNTSISDILGTRAFLNVGQSRLLFVYFRSFHVTIQLQIEKCVNIVLEIRPQGRRIVGSDGSTKQWQPIW